MSAPVTVTFRHVDHSKAVETRIHKKISKLERLCVRLMRCNVVVQGPSAHHTKGGEFKVRIELSVPGSEIVATNPHGARRDQDDVYIALRDAFENAKRQLQALAKPA